MASSAITTKYRRLAIIFTLLSWALLLVPFSVYFVGGIALAQVVGTKVLLTAGAAMAIILFALCAVNKWTFRSKAWIIVLTLYFVVDHFLAMIFVFGICQILDELVVSPLAKHFRAKTSINREIDKRTPQRTEGGENS